MNSSLNALASRALKHPVESYLEELAAVRASGAATKETSGYTALAWNQFAGFLLGLPSSFAKDVQTETMTGREWQNALLVGDRWRVTPNQKVRPILGEALGQRDQLVAINSKAFERNVRGMNIGQVIFG